MTKALLLLALLLSNFAYAIDDTSLALGWYWGKDEAKQKVVVKKQNTTTKTITPIKSDAEILKDINQEVDEKKATAILNPTIANIAKYTAIQNKVVNLASNFTQGWSKTMLLHPELNYIAKNPTDNYAQQIIKEERQINTKNALEVFSKNYGLIFFFNGNEGVSTFQSKIVSGFIEKHNVAIIPVALNGIPNQYFSKIVPDNGRAEKLGVKVSPTIIALNMKTGTTSTLAVGVVAQFELEDIVYDFINQGYQYG